MTVDASHPAVRHAMRFRIDELQGNRCVMPWCDNHWIDLSHIEDSGMGGRPSTFTEENLTGMCRSCHHDYHHNRSKVAERLLNHVNKQQRRDRALLSLRNE